MYNVLLSMQFEAIYTRLNAFKLWNPDLRQDLQLDIATKPSPSIYLFSHGAIKF